MFTRKQSETLEVRSTGGYLAALKRGVHRTKSSAMTRYHRAMSARDKRMGITPIVRGPEETLATLIETEASLSRLGDGEFLIIFGRGIPYQVFNPELARRLREVLHKKLPDHIVAVPAVFGDSPGRTEAHRSYWLSHLAEYRHRYLRAMDLRRVYYETSTTRIYSRLQDQDATAACFDQWRMLWDDRDIIFIEGAQTRLGVGNDLFSNARSIRRIIGPSENAFDRYEEILEAALRQGRDALFILALGPTATVLAFELAKNGFRALDLGHIDIEYEWFRRGATNVVVVGKYVNEAEGGKVVEESFDKDYDRQIIYSIADIS